MPPCAIPQLLWLQRMSVNAQGPDLQIMQVTHLITNLITNLMQLTNLDTSAPGLASEDAASAPQQTPAAFGGGLPGAGGRKQEAGGSGEWDMPKLQVALRLDEGPDGSARMRLRVTPTEICPPSTCRNSHSCACQRARQTPST